MSTLTIVQAVTPPDREACTALRFAVFVDEQSVPAEIELDEYEAAALHFLARQNGIAVATARVVFADPATAKIGRVAVAQQFRQQGIGAALMREIEADPQLAQAAWLVLESQVHAVGFYQRLGYVAAGPVFMEAGIAHQHMEKLRG